MESRPTDVINQLIRQNRVNRSFRAAVGEPKYSKLLYQQVAVSTLG